MQSLRLGHKQIKADHVKEIVKQMDLKNENKTFR